MRPSKKSAKEPLINSEAPVAHGGATKINNYS